MEYESNKLNEYKQDYKQDSNLSDHNTKNNVAGAKLFSGVNAPHNNPGSDTPLMIPLPTI